MRVAFQGELGAFSQQAIQQLLGAKARPIAHERFDQVFAALDKGSVDAAAIPIENTLHGSIHENYDLLLKYDFAITAETNVRIVHNLIAPPGLTFAKVRKVYSHPVAINQCLDFSPPQAHRTRAVLRHGGQREDDHGNAPAGRRGDRLGTGGEDLQGSHPEARHRRRSPELHALLSARAGRLETSRQQSGQGPWKTSLVFSTKNIPGALFRSLSALALRDLNLVKIESRPLRGKPWEYLFYLDLLGRRDDEAVKNALAHLGEVADFLRVLGSYRAAG